MSVSKKPGENELQVQKVPEKRIDQIAKDCHFQGIVFGIPTFGMVSDSFAMSQQTMAMPIFMNAGYHYVRGKPVDVARNEIAWHAYHNKVGYVFFRDDDTIAPRDALIKMIKRFPSHERRDPLNKANMVIGGVVYSKTEPPSPMIFKRGHTGGFEDWELNDLVECEAMGMGCTLIPIGAFVKTLPYVKYAHCINLDCPVRWDKQHEAKNFRLDAPPPCPHCSQPLLPMWFKTVRDVNDDGVPAQMTEDAYFLEKCTKAGMKIYADCGVQCQHEVFHPDPRMNKTYFHHPQIGPCWQQGAMLYYYPVDGDPIHEKMALKPRKNGKRNGKVKFNIGSGLVHLKGYVNIDLHTESDFRCDVRDLSPAIRKYGQADEVRASHIMEHLTRQDLPKSFRSWLRALKPGGKLLVEVPDFVWTLEQVLENRKNGSGINEHFESVLFGGQTHAGDVHQSGIDGKRLEALCRSAKNQIAKYNIRTVFPKDYNQQVIRATIVKKK
jgi:predicted SAM-dependent methyltransferase